MQVTGLAPNGVGERPFGLAKGVVEYGPDLVFDQLAQPCPGLLPDYLVYVAGGDLKVRYDSLHFGFEALLKEGLVL